MSGIFLRQKFFASAVQTIPLSTKGFIRRTSSNATIIYDIPSDTVIPGTNLTSLSISSDQGAVAGNGVKGVWKSGTGAQTSKYAYYPNTTSNGTNFSVVNGTAATSISTMGLYSAVGSGSGAITNKYFFSNDTTSTGSTLSNGNGTLQSGVGNSVYAAILRSSTATDKYTYSNDVVTATTAFGIGSLVEGTSNATYGLLSQSTNTKKFTFAGEGVANGTALSASSFGAFGNSTLSIRPQGNTTGAANKYTYSNDSVGVTGAVMIGSRGMPNSAISNGITGVNA